MEVEVKYATEFGISQTTMEISELKNWINKYNFKIYSIEEQGISYSEEEVLEIIRQYALEEHLITSSKPDIWFKQYKKK